MAIAACIPILCPQNQFAICSLTENILLYFLTAEKRYNSDCWNDITSATKKTFAQHIFNQKLQCLQICIIFKKQSNCQWGSRCSRHQLSTYTPSQCSAASRHLLGEPLHKSWGLILVGQRKLFRSDFQRLWSPLSSIKQGRLHLITTKTCSGRKYRVSQYELCEQKNSFTKWFDTKSTFRCSQCTSATKSWPFRILSVNWLKKRYQIKITTPSADAIEVVPLTKTPQRTAWERSCKPEQE